MSFQAPSPNRKNQQGKTKQQAIGLSILNQSADYQISGINATQMTGIVKGSAPSRQIINQSMFTDPSGQNSAARAAIAQQAKKNKLNRHSNNKYDANTSRYGDNYPSGYKHGQLEELTLRQS